ncbi:DUF551 domain-containing protein [Citrobacter portucalensis]|uniref:DUF551 domain-containing protein n=1 Tax=Citrobacter portucalensis TaxID=1639133 RepID=UPI00140FAA85|nr:DUF551 domain-containing protein [Citrobacter portucalensis]NHR80769.1 DUF551 domain-containing protein [Citrobacter portucalensis]
MTTNNHSANGPVSLDRLHQISEILSKAAAQSEGGNLGYAMADAVKVIDGAIAAFGAEPVAWLRESAITDIREGSWTPIIQMESQRMGVDLSESWGVNYIPLYTAPPAPVAMKDHQIRELVNDLRDIAIEYHGTQQLRERIARTVRAAMLQAGNSPVTPEGWIPVSERMPESDGNYWGWWSESKRQGPVWFIKSDLQAQFQSSEITHWMSLPAAPQQEDKA